MDVIVSNFNRRVSGVTATVRRLVLFQAPVIPMALVGHQVDDLPGHKSLFDVLRVLQQKGDRPTVWHARRNNEMLLAIFLRSVMGYPLRLLFTSAAQRRHTRYTRWLMRKMDRIVVPCQASGDYLDLPYTVVHHGIDLDEFSYTPRSVESNPVIAQVGRVRRQKGSDIFVAALIPLLQKYPQLQVKMVGLITPKHQSYANALKQKLSDAGVDAQVQWISDLPWPALKQLYESVDVLVACPRNEGFGLTPLEAMASGATVVVNQAGAFPDMVDDGVQGRIVPVDDVAALESALDFVLQNPERRIEMAQRAYERVEKEFTIQREAQRLVEIYRQMLTSTDHTEPPH